MTATEYMLKHIIYAFTVRTCNEVVITHASKSPDQATYNYNTNVVYSCDVGYELTSGDLTRTCKADTTWSDTAPVCTRKY